MLHGRTRPFARTGARSPDAPTQAETTSWQAQVVTNGGTVSAGRFTIVNNFVAAEKASGTWALTDDYWGLWAENAIQARTSLKQRRLATEVAVPMFTIDRGYTGNGTTSYVNTGFSTVTHGVAMTPNSCRVAAYCRLNIQDNRYVIGASDGSGRSFIILPRTASDTLIATANNDSSTFALPAADSRGLTATSRTGATAAGALAYKNGVALTRTVDPATITGVLTTDPLAILASSAGAPSFFSSNQVGFACIGAFFTPAQEAAQYTNVQAWAVAVGANV